MDRRSVSSTHILYPRVDTSFPKVPLSTETTGIESESNDIFPCQSYHRDRSIGRDPIYFEDPEVFNPQRWISSEGTIRDDLKSFMFGYGRRACPGQALATTYVVPTLEAPHSTSFTPVLWP